MTTNKAFPVLQLISSFMKDNQQFVTTIFVTSIFINTQNIEHSVMVEHKCW